MIEAPLKDLLFVLHEQLGVQQLAGHALFADYSPDVAGSILEEAGRFAAEILEPLNVPGDRAGSRWTPEGVVAPPGFREAYKRYIDDGWTQLGVETKHGGQGAPLVLATAVEEIWFASNVAFMLCPQLGRGAVEALSLAGSPELQQRFLPKMVSGEWAGTMNLTEPQAGSDLAAIRTRAVPEGDHYRLFGQKIFITWGEHDLTDNIVHLVLARVEGAPAGVKGISLFVVPKIIDGARNDLRCVSIEHKLGIHASPTCVMSYGDSAGAIGYLVGEVNRGLAYMFIMMNSARLSVGVQGIGLSERAYQQALQWARTRVQGRPVGAPAQGASSGAAPTIIEHPDVRRMLLSIRAGVESMRALALHAALQLDLAHAADDPRALARGELLIPIVKGWSTEQANEHASTAVQVHGGMGFIEETGVAQTLRDARITAIYEGTTAIQANDLIGRKLLRDRGAALQDVTATLQAMLDQAQGVAGQDVLAAEVQAVRVALERVLACGRALCEQAAASPPGAFAVSVPFLKLCGLVFSSALLVQGALLAQQRAGTDASFAAGKRQTARFQCAHALPGHESLAAVVLGGADSVVEARPELL